MNHTVVVVSEPDTKKLTVDVTIDGEPVTLKLRDNYYKAGLHKGRRLLNFRVDNEGVLEWYQPDSYAGDNACTFLLNLRKEVNA